MTVLWFWQKLTCLSCTEKIVDTVGKRPDDFIVKQVENNLDQKVLEKNMTLVSVSTRERSIFLTLFINVTAEWGTKPLTIWHKYQTRSWICVRLSRNPCHPMRHPNNS